MKKRNKIQPSEMTITLSTDPFGAGTGAGRFYIDLSQIASIVNRRFYRQGINWAVAGFKLVSPDSGTCTISKLPNTWVTSNAWEKAFRAWNKQQKDDVDEAGAQSAMAKFRDFKVFMNPNHVDQYLASGADLNATNLLPLALSGPAVIGGPTSFAQATGGEWEASQIVVPNTVADASGSLVLPREYFLHMVGINNNGGFSRGVLEGYADSRAYLQSPDPVAPDLGSGENWLRDMFNVGDDNSEVIRNATDKNDELPYPQVDYPGGETQLAGLQIHDTVNIFPSNGTPGTVIGSQRIKGGNFPCGLIALDWAPVGGQGISVLIDLVPGNHRGYLCEPMTEM